MARIWQSGAELQSVTAGVEFTTISVSVPSISTTTVRSGSASVRFNPSGTTQALEHTVNGSDVTGTNYYRAYIYINTPTSNISTSVTGNNTDITIMGLRNSGGYWCELTIDASNKLRIYSDGSSRTLLGTTGNLKLKTWYRVEIGYGSASSYVEARLDGALIGKSTAVAGLGGFNAVGFGAGLLTTESSTSDIFFDDLAINDNTGSSQISFPGEGKIVHLKPNAAGDSNGFTVQVGGTAGSANNFTRVNEIIPDDATTYNGAALLNAEDLFNCDNFTGGAFSSINVVAVGVRMADLVAGDATTGVKMELMKTTGGTKTQSANLIPNSTSFITNAAAAPRNYPIISYTNPDGGEWTQTFLDSMQIGYINDTVGVQTIAISTIWASVDYTLTSPGTTTSTSSTSMSSTSSSSTSSSTSSTSSSTSSTSSSISSTSTSLSTSSTSNSTSSTSSSISSTSSSTSSTSISSTSSSTSTSSTSSSISSTSMSSTSLSSTSSSTSISSTSSSFSSTSSSISSTSASTSSTSFSSTSSSSSTSTTTLPPPNLTYTYEDKLVLNLPTNFPTNAVLDNFDRANTNPPPSTSWTQGMLNFNANDGIKILSNQATQGTTNATFDQGDYWNVNTFGPDSEVFCTIAQVPTSSAHGIRLYLRLASVGAGTSNGYLIHFGVPRTGGDTFIQRMTNASGTTIARTTTNHQNGDIIGLQMVGSTLYAKINNTVVLSVTDTTYSAAGYIGLSFAGTTPIVDRFGGGNIDGANLLNPFTTTQYGNVASDDGDYFIEYGSEYMVREYKRKNANNTDTPAFTWRGRSTQSTMVSPILIQIYNVNSAAWETLAIANTIPADTDFSVSVSQSTSISNYYDSSNTVTFRSYQQVI